MNQSVYATVTTQEENEIELTLDVDFTLSKEWDDFRKWQEIDINEVVINIDKEDAEVILAEGIKKIVTGELCETDTNIEYFFGSIENFITELEKVV